MKCGKCVCARGLALLVALGVAGISHATDYIEGTDLSNVFSAPTNMGALTVGSNLLGGTVNTASELDYVTFNVPAGHVLSQLMNTTYVSQNSPSFIGMQAGSAFTVAAPAATESSLLGYAHFGSSTVGTNILPLMGTAFGAQGFAPPLAAGPYTLWIQQASSLATQYQFNLVVAAVPEPQSIALVMLGVVSAGPLFRRRAAS